MTIFFLSGFSFFCGVFAYLPPPSSKPPPPGKCLALVVYKYAFLNPTATTLCPPPLLLHFPHTGPPLRIFFSLFLPPGAALFSHSPKQSLLPSFHFFRFCSTCLFVPLAGSRSTMSGPLFFHIFACHYVFFLPAGKPAFCRSSFFCPPPPPFEQFTPSTKNLLCASCLTYNLWLDYRSLAFPSVY